jgi:succinate-acetate transporter protein
MSRTLFIRFGYVITISYLAHGHAAFTSYGAFWLSYATILIPGSGILTAYASEDELSQALGIYLITWFVLTFMFL